LTVFQKKEAEWGINTGRYYGLSIENKPTTDIVKGSVFIEIDTGKKFIYNETAWVERFEQGKTYREAMSQAGKTWMESFLINTNTDLADEIGATYTTLSLIDVHTIAGSNTLAVVNTTDFTGTMHYIYDVVVTKAGAMATAEFKWRWKTLISDWSDWTEGVVTAADNDLGNNVVINWTGITSVLADEYRVHGECSWHIPADGYKSFLTRWGIRFLDATPAQTYAYARLLIDDNHVWEILDRAYSGEDLRTPLYLLGDGIKQIKMEFKEITKADVEYLYFYMRGWDEAI